MKPVRVVQAALRHDVVVSGARVLAGSAVAVLANGLAGVISARALPVSGKGLLAMALTIGPLLWVVASLGTNVALRVELPKADGTVSIAGYRRLTVRLAGVQAVLTAVLVVGAAAWMPDVVLTWGFLVVIGLLSVATFLSSQGLEALHALGRSARATRVDAAGAVLALLLMAVLVASGPGRSLLVMLCCYLAGYLFRIGCAALELRRLQARGRVPAGGRRLLRRGVSFLGSNVGQVVAFRADRYLLGPLAGPAAVGIYSVAATPAELLRLPVTAVGQIMMQRSAAAGLSAVAVRRGCLLAAVITVPPAGALFALSDVVVVGLFGQRYAAAAGVLRIMVCSEVLVCFFILLSRVAAGAGLARATGVSSGLGAVTGLVALACWAPAHGAAGAAWASFVAYAVMLATCAAAVHRAVGRGAARRHVGDVVAPAGTGSADAE